MIRFDNLPPEVMQAMCTPMHEVLSTTVTPGHAPSGALYIGSLAAVQDKEMLREHRVTHLVQVLDVPWLPASEKDGFSTYRISIDDAITVDIRPHLEAACNYIDTSLRSGRNVLVHCQQGVSRSAAVILAYLIRNRGMTYDSAYAYLKRKRACVKPNPTFIQALQEWEATSRRPSMVRRFTT
ncbi:phosphatases II [Macrolepiota fuliginosa MF-IS2]|uniref:protein-tyrosine-phosphatase n=1 Tax=Macrolepiota fuliginosa MF-IS2 TaxID=1400762 RepID=A0A9P6C0J0_9AGAR|nr:phosphatases II [Macrolepiota fuliginosa MF-IS2]